MSDNEIAPAMTRNYDLSKLSVPLWKCTRAYSGLSVYRQHFVVHVVQREDMTIVDAEVYSTDDVRDATEAANELCNMIKAARMLRGL